MSSLRPTQPGHPHRPITIAQSPGPAAPFNQASVPSRPHRLAHAADRLRGTAAEPSFIQSSGRGVADGLSAHRRRPPAAACVDLRRRRLLGLPTLLARRRDLGVRSVRRPSLPGSGARGRVAAVDRRRGRNRLPSPRSNGPPGMSSHFRDVFSLARHLIRWPASNRRLVAPRSLSRDQPVNGSPRRATCSQTPFSPVMRARPAIQRRVCHPIYKGIVQALALGGDDTGNHDLAGHVAQDTVRLTEQGERVLRDAVVLLDAAALDDHARPVVLADHLAHLTGQLLGRLPQDDAEARPVHQGGRSPGSSPGLPAGCGRAAPSATWCSASTVAPVLAAMSLRALVSARAAAGSALMSASVNDGSGSSTTSARSGMALSCAAVYRSTRLFFSCSRNRSSRQYSSRHHCRRAGRR